MEEGKRRKRGKTPKACYSCHKSHKACNGARPCAHCIARNKAHTCRDYQEVLQSMEEHRNPTQTINNNIESQPTPPKTLQPELRIPPSRPWAPFEPMRSGSIPPPNLPFPLKRQHEERPQVAHDRILPYPRHHNEPLQHQPSWHFETTRPPLKRQRLEDEAQQPHPPQNRFPPSQHSQQPQSQRPQSSQPQSQQPQQPPHNAQGSAGGVSVELLGSLLDEVRKLKDHVAQFEERDNALSREMLSLKQQQQMYQSEIQNLKAENTLLKSMLTKRPALDCSLPFMPFVLESADEAFSMLSNRGDPKDFHYLYVSPRFCQIFQASQEELQNVSTHDCDLLVPGPETEDLKKQMEKFMFNPDEPVSPIITITAHWKRLREGTFRGSMRMQLFYRPDGTPSFIVAALEQVHQADHGSVRSSVKIKLVEECSSPEEQGSPASRSSPLASSPSSSSSSPSPASSSSDSDGSPPSLASPASGPSGSPLTIGGGNDSGEGSPHNNHNNRYSPTHYYNNSNNSNDPKDNRSVTTSPNLYMMDAYLWTFEQGVTSPRHT